MNVKYGYDYVKKYRRKEGEGRLERMLVLFDVGKGDSVLDIGCGNGFLADLVKGKVKSYAGIDTSSTFVEEAKKRFKNEVNCVFYNESSRKHLRRKIKYDRIFLMDVSEHMTDKIFLEVLKDMRILLKKNGKAYLHTPNREYFLEQLKQIGILKQTFGHIAVRSAPDYVYLLNKAGYGVEVTYLNHYLGLLNWFSFLKYLPFIGCIFNARLFMTIWKNES